MNVLGFALVLAAIALIMLIARRGKDRRDDASGADLPFVDGGGDGGVYDHHDSGGFDGGHDGFDGGHGGDAAGGGDSGAGGDGGGGDGGGH